MESTTEILCYLLRVISLYRCKSWPGMYRAGKGWHRYGRDFFILLSDNGKGKHSNR